VWSENGLASAIKLNGAISTAIINWFAFSQDVLNIHAGRLDWHSGKRGFDDDTLVPKYTFTEKPEIIAGVTKFEFSCHHEAHPLWFKVDIEDDNDPMDEND
jgi:hypothetical protein